MATHDSAAFEAYQQYRDSGQEAYLLRTCLSLSPLANSLSYRFKLRMFDADAAINDCFSATYYSLKKGKAVFVHRRALWEYYYKKYLCICRRYINKHIRPPNERNLELEDLYRFNYIFSKTNTTKDVEDRIFIEEELPNIIRKEFNNSLRFEGIDRECCLSMLESALAGHTLRSLRKFKHQTNQSIKFLRDYTRVRIRVILYKYYNKFTDSLFTSEKLAAYYDTE